MEHSIYLYAAIFGCTLVGIQVILQVFGLFDTDVDVDGAHDVDVGADMDMDVHDADGIHDHDSSAFFGILSFKALCAFAGIFGLVGLMMMDRGAAMPTRVLVSCGAGVVAMFGVASLMRGLSRLQASGTVQPQNAIGHSATVYLKVPEAGAGPGKVTVEVQGRSMEFPAITDGDAIPTGTRVTVVAVEGNDTLKVTPV